MNESKRQRRTTQTLPIVDTHPREIPLACTKRTAAMMLTKPPTLDAEDVDAQEPPSPPMHKRLRIHADDDSDNSSSCKDVEDVILPADSVPAFVAQIRHMLEYVSSKPTLSNGSASFIRDYLRTMLLQNEAAARDALALEGGLYVKGNLFGGVPEEILKHIFGFLDGRNLARVREVCRKWGDYASEESLWRSLCLKKWRALDTDAAAWKLIDKNFTPDTPNKWRRVYPKVAKTPQWRCRLQKTGRFICNLVAHQIGGQAIGDSGLPDVLVVERRFNILHLQTFIMNDASILYFEPEKEADVSGFEDFIDYLIKRTRAGLALEDQQRFIFIPPCDYTRNTVGYQGKSLLGVVQNAYPP